VSAVACAPQSTTRGKLDEAAFRRPHRGILANTPEASPWKGRRILAVDGSKIALPRELADHGYRVPDGAHYPQAMAIAHRERGLHFVFRIKRNANPAFDAFIASGETERTVTLDAPRDETAPRGRTLRVRLVRYVAGDTEYCLATSLTDGGRFGVRALSDLYHGRWGIAETSGSGKAVIESFHAKSVRGVRQELYAAFTLVTLARRFSSRRDGDLNAGSEGDGLPEMRANPGTARARSAGKPEPRS